MKDLYFQSHRPAPNFSAHQIGLVYVISKGQSVAFLLVVWSDVTWWIWSHVGQWCRSCRKLCRFCSDFCLHLSFIRTFFLHHKCNWSSGSKKKNKHFSSSVSSQKIFRSIHWRYPHSLLKLDNEEWRQK